MYCIMTYCDKSYIISNGRNCICMGIREKYFPMESGKIVWYYTKNEEILEIDKSDTFGINLYFLMVCVDSTKEIKKQIIKNYKNNIFSYNVIMEYDELFGSDVIIVKHNHKTEFKYSINKQTSDFEIDTRLNYTMPNDIYKIHCYIKPDRTDNLIKELLENILYDDLTDIICTYL